MMELTDTVALMNSEDYKEGFKAEYYQTKIRYEKLKAFNNKLEAAKRTEYMAIAVAMPTHDCPEDVLREQQALMGQYLHILEVRAVIEGIELDNLTTSEGERATMQKYYEDYLKQPSAKEYDSTITCSSKTL
jgi:hypothetical protein